MENLSYTNPIDQILDNVRLLSKEIVKKLLLVEEFSAPQIATYTLHNFQMTTAEDLGY